MCKHAFGTLPPVFVFSMQTTPLSSSLVNYYLHLQVTKQYELNRSKMKLMILCHCYPSSQ